MKTTMISTKALGLFLVLIVVGVLSAYSASAAFADIQQVVVNGAEFDSFTPTTPSTAVFAGDVIPIRVTFTADTGNNGSISDVRVIARILGEAGLSEASERFVVVDGQTYSRLLNIQLPYDLDDTHEPYILEITVESKSQTGATVQVALEVQRSSYQIEILSLESPDKVLPGQNLPLDIVLKNRGFESLEDTFVEASIPELGIKKKVYFSDLSPNDQSDPDKEDAVSGRLYLSIPADAPAGLYNVQVKAYNTDALTIASKKVVIASSSSASNTYPGSTSKSFGVGAMQTYSLTLVNTGDNVQVYQLVIDAPNGLNVETDSNVVVVPAGSSKTVSLTASSDKAGTYDFSVSVLSNGDVVKVNEFSAKVGGKSLGSAATLLTVILAIIFVVLVIVLIVLLTRRSDKPENFGESYY